MRHQASRQSGAASPLRCLCTISDTTPSQTDSHTNLTYNLTTPPTLITKLICSRCNLQRPGFDLSCVLLSPNHCARRLLVPLAGGILLRSCSHRDGHQIHHSGAGDSRRFIAKGVILSADIFGVLE